MKIDAIVSRAQADPRYAEELKRMVCAAVATVPAAAAPRHAFAVSPELEKLLAEISSSPEELRKLKGSLQDGGPHELTTIVTATTVTLTSTTTGTVVTITTIVI